MGQSGNPFGLKYNLSLPIHHSKFPPFNTATVSQRAEDHLWQASGH